MCEKCFKRVTVLIKDRFCKECAIRKGLIKPHDVHGNPVRD